MALQCQAGDTAHPLQDSPRRLRSADRFLGILQLVRPRQHIASLYPGMYSTSTYEAHIHCPPVGYSLPDFRAKWGLSCVIGQAETGSYFGQHYPQINQRVLCLLTIGQITHPQKELVISRVAIFDNLPDQELPIDTVDRGFLH